MKYFISESGDVYGYESDGSQDAFIKKGLRQLSHEEFSQIQAEWIIAAQPTGDQLRQIVDAKRDELLMVAGLRIAPLQDAVDLGRATQRDSAMLLQWKQYRIDVNRVTLQSGYPVEIQWPAQPME